MRDKTHMEQVIRQAQYVREHPTEWKKEHTEFINAIYEKALAFAERLSTQPGGKEKLAKMYGLKNRKGNSQS